MDRREFLCTGLGVALATGAASSDSWGQALASTPAPAQLAPKKLIVDAYSRHLQWLRSPEEVAATAAEMGFGGLDITVMPYPGHVDPAKVREQLPPYVNAARKQGLRVSMIRCPIADTTTPYAEDIIATASSLGVTHYWGGTFRYEQGKQIQDQLDALKPRLGKLAALNAKYKMTGTFHTYAMSTAVGAAVWDFLYLFKDFDPTQIGIHYDCGHMANHSNGIWELNMRAAGRYIAAVSVKDFTYEQNLGLPGRGEPSPGTINAPGTAAGRGATAPSPPAGGNPPAGGADRGGAPRGGENSPVAGAADRGGAQGAGGAGGGRGGRGGGAAAPGGQGGSTGNGWTNRQVPLGTGVLSLPRIAELLKEIGFSGPLEIQYEYPMGDADRGQDKITLPREEVLGAMKRDLLTLQRGFAASGLL